MTASPIRYRNRYFESGFPHDKHQFGSFIGSVFATMALMEAAAVGPRTYTGSVTGAGLSPGR